MAVDDRHEGGDRNRYRNPYRGRGGPGLDTDEYRAERPRSGLTGPDRGGVLRRSSFAEPARPLAGPHRGRGPKGYRRSDERIREDVNERLTDDPYVDASEIEVTVSAGEVTLSGTVDSRPARRRAEDIAEAVSGVIHVQNNLRVEPLEATRTRGGVPLP